MKKWTKYLGLVMLVLLPVFVLVGIANAQSFRTGDHTTVASDEVIDSSLYTMGRNVDIAGRVNGDVFCAAQTVTVSGTVDGDVLCAAQTIHVTGTVSGDVRLAAQTATIAGMVDGSVSVVSQSFSLADDGEVARDLGAAGDSLALNGQVGRDVSAAGTTVSLAGRVGRNVTASTDDLTINAQTRVGGNVEYTSANEAAIADGAQIAGTTVRNEREAPQESRGSYARVIGFGLTFGVFVILSLVLTSLALVLLFPALIHQTAKRAIASPLKTFLTGFLANLAIPVLIVSLMITGVGFPLGLLATLLWLVVLFLAGPFFSYMLGRLLLSQQNNPVLVMVIGSLVVTVVYLIPIVGFLMLLAVVWFGTGMIIREIYHRTPKPKYDIK